MPVPMADQLARKVAWVSKVIGRVPDAVHPSPQTLGYRARITLRPGPDGRLGYSAPRSHDAIPVDACAVTRPRIQAALSRLPPMPGLAAVELRTDDAHLVLAARRKGRRGKLPRLDLDALGLDGIALDGKRLTGTVQLQLPLGSPASHTQAIGPQTFFQVNPEVNAVLVGLVSERVRSVEPAGILDLYAGAGNLSLGLAAEGIRTVLVESSAAACRDAQATVDGLGLNVEVRKADAHRFAAGDTWFDVAILDPPRMGAPGRLVELALTRPKRVLYVACHPPALARDLASLRGHGYHLTELHLLDMFPHTPHVELLAMLEPT